MDHKVLIILSVLYALFVITATFSYVLCVRDGKLGKSILHTLCILVPMAGILPIIAGVYFGLKIYKVLAIDNAIEEVIEND